MLKPSATEYAGTLTLTLAGMKMASIISMMAVADRAMSCMRLETLPEITEEQRRPTSISSQ